MELEVLLPSRVTVVTAPAGFGKTHYLARLRDRPGTVWVDAAVTDDPLALVTLALGPPARRVLVVDDAQGLGADSDVVRLLGRAVRSPMAPTLIAVAGRPPLPVHVPSGSVSGGITRITEHELRLDAARLASLLDRQLAPPTDPGLVDALLRLTGGWPGLVSVAVGEATRSGGATASDVVDGWFERGGPCLDYVHECVLADLPPAATEILALVAQLGSTPVDTLVGSGLDPFGAGVDLLLRRRLLRRDPADSGSVELSDALGEALRRTLLGLPRRPARRLRRIADHHLRVGDPVRAIRVFTLLGDVDRVAGVVAAHGDDLLRAGRAQGLVDAVTDLPAEGRDPRLTMLEGQARQVLGDHDGALDCYLRLAGDADELDPGLAWRMGVIHYLRGEPAEALACYRRGRIGDETTADEAQLLAWTASALWIHGDAEASGDYATRALAAARACGDDSTLAAAHVAMALHAGLTGARRELNEHYDQALTHAQRAGDALQVVRVCTNRGSHLVDEGHIERALTDLDLARTTAHAAGFVAFEALAEVNTGDARLRLGQLDEASAAFERALALYQRMGSRKIAYALTGLGDVHRTRGAASLARAAYAEAVEVGDSGEDVQSLGPALCGLAAVMGIGDAGAGLALARRAVALPGAGLARAQVTLGWLTLGSDPVEAARLGAAAEESAVRHRDWVTLAESQELQALATDGDRRRRLLREAEHAWERSGARLGVLVLRHARSMLARGGESADVQGREARLELDRLGVVVDEPVAVGLLSHLPRELGGRVDLVTLGGFAVLRDGRPVGGPMAQSRKARDLVKILVARDGRVPREEVMGLLWPADDVAALGNRLAVAVTAVRRSLDPEHLRPADWVLASGEDALWLDPRHVHVDVHRFLSDAGAALRAARSGPGAETSAVGVAVEAAAAVAGLEAVVASWTGDFLSDDPYSGWAVPMREHVRSVRDECVAELDRLRRGRGPAQARSSSPLRVVRSEPRGRG